MGGGVSVWLWLSRSQAALMEHARAKGRRILLRLEAAVRMMHIL